MGAAQANESKIIRYEFLRILERLELSDGVFKPNAGTFALAECMRGLSGSFLDLGTGTGFVSIIISEDAHTLVASDCSTSAVRCAEGNFKRFAVNAELRTSDMFENVPESFDYIVFNPPIHIRESEADRRLKNRLRRLLPGPLTTLVSVLAQPIFKYTIRSVIRRFYLDATRHLNPGGTIFVNTLSPDIQWLLDLIGDDMQLMEYRRSRKFHIVGITSPPSSKTGVEWKYAPRAFDDPENTPV